MPGSHGGIICKHEDGIQAVCQGYGDLEQKPGSDVTPETDEPQLTDFTVDLCKEKNLTLNPTISLKQLKNTGVTF